MVHGRSGRRQTKDITILNDLSSFRVSSSYFSYVLAGEAKICNRIENGIKVVCVFLSEIYHKASSILTLFVP